MAISEETLGPNIRVRKFGKFQFLEKERIIKELHLVADFQCGNCEYEERNVDFSILDHSVIERNGFPVVETTAEYECPQCYALTELVGQEDQATFTCVFTVEN